MLWLLWLSCRPEPVPPPSGPMVEPGTYSFWPGKTVPGCTAPLPEAQLVHLPTLTPIRRTLLNRSGRYNQVEVRGTGGWIATSHADDPRILMMLSSDEPGASCLQAEVIRLDKDHWFTRTPTWLALIDLTTSRVYRLAKTGGDLTKCRVEESTLLCRGPRGDVRFDHDGVVVSGDYRPQWSVDLD